MGLCSSFRRLPLQVQHIEYYAVNAAMKPEGVAHPFAAFAVLNEVAVNASSFTSSNVKKAVVAVGCSRTHAESARGACYDASVATP